MKKMCYFRSVSLGVRTELCESVVVVTVTYGAGTWGIRKEGRCKLTVMDMKWRGVGVKGRISD